MCRQPLQTRKTASIAKCILPTHRLLQFCMGRLKRSDQLLYSAHLLQFIDQRHACVLHWCARRGFWSRNLKTPPRRRHHHLLSTGQRKEIEIAILSVWWRLEQKMKAVVVWKLRLHSPPWWRFRNLKALQLKHGTEYSWADLFPWLIISQGWMEIWGVQF